MVFPKVRPPTCASRGLSDQERAALALASVTCRPPPTPRQAQVEWPVAADVPSPSDSGCAFVLPCHPWTDRQGLSSR